MKRLISAICVLFFLLPLSAQETYQKETFISSRGDTLQYRLLQPENMKKSEKYPLVLFLHGAGERGNDNERQLTHGGQMFLNPVNGRNTRHSCSHHSVPKRAIGHTRHVLNHFCRMRCR